MIDKYEKITCNGCKLCSEICPKHAISYAEDEFGFWHPKVNYDLCIHCSLCVNKCPNKTKINVDKVLPLVKAAWSKDNSIRLKSTSGGIFFELANFILKNQGYVCGCAYDSDFKGAHHVLIDKIEDLEPLMVSKYVESDTEGIYSKIKIALNTNNYVLFVGAPCQCAALYSYLGKDYENLIVVDFLCRGANSPKAHKKYIEYLEKKYQSKMVKLRSKDKRNGWNKFGQSAEFENGETYYASRNDDLRVVAYHKGNLMMRSSCLECKFKELPRYSDLTLGDFWGIDPSEVYDVEKGVSLVFINSKKGQKIFENISDQVNYIDKTLEDALKGNVAIFESATKGKNRDKFLLELDEYPFDYLVNKYKNKEKPFIIRLLQKIKRKIIKIFRRR